MYVLLKTCFKHKIPPFFLLLKYCNICYLVALLAKVHLY